ncbi:type I-U CRISPR-associated RAMP protein Csb1/Cas7u [Candidatus Poriferisodalis sp.]|uniref:type I-G CRISPR-associated RAMP protein Csb1/Cas7g n=1 Tax=Candidatus Poriferisodalis sp. TaxID=3101277 RepID=UPI003B01C721
MTNQLEYERLLHGCRDDSFDDGLLIEAELEPVAGSGGTVKPAVYEGGRYQTDRRWASPSDAVPQDVVVIDNVPSQANRHEEQLRMDRAASGLPELLLDLSDMANLPSHLPRVISSFQFPHRNADAYLRDALCDGVEFSKTNLGRAIFHATASEAGPLAAWFPQALLYGFWQSHLGKKRTQAKHARAWVSEIIGWQPASRDTRVMGLKGDPLNLSIDEAVMHDPNDYVVWEFGTKKADGAEKKTKLSELGHGQVPFMSQTDGAPAGVSFRRVTQRASLSLAQLRRVSMGSGSADADAAVRALVAAIGLHAHTLAFGRGFALRSGAELRTARATVTWLGADGDQPVELGGIDATRALLGAAKAAARDASVPMDGWDADPLRLTPSDRLRKAVVSSWPDLAD